MKLETLYAANRILSELRRWQEIDTRLSLGDEFYRLSFIANESKILPDKYEVWIKDKNTIDAYKKFVDSMIKHCEDRLAKM